MAAPGMAGVKDPEGVGEFFTQGVAQDAGDPLSSQVYFPGDARH